MKHELAAGTLTERAKFQYVLVLAIVSAFIFDFPFMETERTFWDRAIWAGSILGAGLGTTWLYACNQGSAGHRFLERYTSITFVYLVRLVVFAGPLMILVIAIAEVAGVLTEYTGPVDACVIAVIEILLYWGSGRHIRDVAQSSPAA